MRKAVLFVVAVSLAAPLAAQQATKKFDYKPVDGIQLVSLAIDQVKINQIVFKPGKAIGGPLRRSAAECVIRIDNDGQADSLAPHRRTDRLRSPDVRGAIAPERESRRRRVIRVVRSRKWSCTGARSGRMCR